MITEEKFLKLLDRQAKLEAQWDKLGSVFDSDVFNSSLHEIPCFWFEELVELYFTTEGADWVFWYVYEKKCNPELKAFDEQGADIPLNTDKDLWNFVKQYRNE